MPERPLVKRGPRIRAMFGRIAPRYDLLNHLLSLGRDRAWRRRAAQRVAAAAPKRTLDACTGTGDMALACAGPGTTYGCDFALPMLERARRKAAATGRALPLFAADALRLPLRDGCLDVVTVAFGIRNFSDLEAGLRELARVLGGGGRLVVVELAEPRGVLAPVLGWWLHRVLPLVGGLVSGDASAYRYLPRSMAEFASGEALTALLAAVGLRPVAPRPMGWGVATLYEAVKPGPGASGGKGDA